MECTVRPVVGEVYRWLYVQFFKTYGYGSSESFEGSQMQIYTPVDDLPDDPYQVFVFIDWFSEYYSEPFVPGQVVECYNTDPYPIEPDYKFSFDPLT